MTWLWPICFSLLALPALLAGSLSGSARLTASLEPAVRKHQDYSGVVIWLEPVDGPEPKPAARHAEMIQKGKNFQPHVLAVPVGSKVVFPNFDPIFHNAFSNFSGQPFDVGLYPPGKSRHVIFQREGIVRVFCNIHPTMSAIIAVLDTPWFAVTSKSGAFRVVSIPDGGYRLHVFHERATEDTLKALEKRITISGETTLEPVAVSETGFIQQPHKNKYGREYPAATDDRVYPGARK